MLSVVSLIFFLGAREACSWSGWVVQSCLKAAVSITAVQFGLVPLKTRTLQLPLVCSACVSHSQRIKCKKKVAFKALPTHQLII